MTQDTETVRIYDAKAQDYADMNSEAAKHPSLIAFIAALPTGARVLDFGCGPGTEAAEIAAAGHAVDATDASAEMIRIADQGQGVTAWEANFDQLDAVATYGGIWANFSLLHAPRADMPRHLGNINKALQPNGIFHIGLKLGNTEKRDPIGRIYSYFNQGELQTMLSDAGFSGFDCAFGSTEGMDGVMVDWITILTRKTNNA